MLTSWLPALAGRLRRFADDAGIAGADVRYVVRERELVPADPGFHPGVVNARARLPTVDLPFLARRIWLKNNLRIEGIERLPGATAKLQIVTRRGRATVMRDLRGRAIGGRLIVDPMIGIPRVRARDMRAGWFIEDFIDGKAATPADIADLVTGHGPSLWLPSARLRRVKRPFQRGLIEALDRSLASVFPPVPEDALWPVGFSHNDLTLDNLLRDSAGKFWLIDWERAGVVPLVSDLGAAYFQAPQLAGAILAILAAADPFGRALPPRHQLALGASLALQRWASGRGFVGAEAKRKGLLERDMIRQFDAITDGYRRSIVRLAG